MKAKLLMPKLVLCSGTSGVFDTAYLGTCRQLVKQGNVVGFKGTKRIYEIWLLLSSFILKASLNKVK